MQITLHPMRRDDRLELSRSGDIVTINGEAFDFSGLPAGATLPRDAVVCDWLAGDVSRDSAADGAGLRLALILPHGAQASEAARTPVPLELSADGPVTLPG